MTACARCLQEDYCYSLAGDLLLDVVVEGAEEDPDAWCLAREALASQLLEELPKTEHAPGCQYRGKV